MKVELCNLGRVKVTLGGNDLQKLGLEISDLQNPSFKNKIILLALFKAAMVKLELPEPHSKILIEAYPHLNGGGVFYFTPLKPERKVFEVKSCPHFAFDFNDGTNLLTTVERLFNNPNTRKIYSKIYDVNGIFRLVLAANPSIVYEFCDNHYRYNEVKKYTCEHGSALTGDNAIYEIGEKLQSL